MKRAAAYIVPIFLIFMMMAINALADFSVSASPSEPYLPSISVAVGREPDVVLSGSDKGIDYIVYRYNDFTDDEYNAFSNYLVEQNCEANEVSMDGDYMTVVLSMDGTEFKFEYDRDTRKVAVTYPDCGYRSFNLEN